jgi:hypothetical protein
MPPLSHPEPAPRLCPVSEISPRPVAWLWPGHLALGKLAILEGDPGLGKSFLALDLCARLSTGRPWPDGAAAPSPAACLILNGEDDAADTVRPRLAALGADPARVFVIEPGEGDLASPLCLPAEVGVLDALVDRAQARLVVIDPVMQFLGPAVNTTSDRSVRRALAPLAALARRRACTILLIRHLTKVGRGRAVHRGLGSIGLVGACRSAWLVAEEAEGSPRLVLAQVKNNLAPRQPSLAFELVHPEDGGAALNWLGPVEITADALLAPVRRTGRDPDRSRAAHDFLAGLLADGPLTSQEVWQRAEEEGVSARTIERVKKALKVRSTWVTVDGRAVSYWLLPEQKLPAEVRPEAEPDDVDRWLEYQNQKFPPPTPLDDL